MRCLYMYLCACACTCVVCILLYVSVHPSIAAREQSVVYAFSVVSTVVFFLLYVCCAYGFAHDCGSICLFVCLQEPKEDIRYL